jgi:multiple sugar transport system permease protein
MTIQRSSGAAALPLAARVRSRLGLRPGVKYKREEIIMGYLFILVPFVIFLTFNLAAMVFDFWISFHRWDVLSPPVSNGTNNYHYIFYVDPVFWTAIGNTIQYAVIVVPIQTTIAFSLALIVSQKIRGKSFFRTTFYFPSVTSSVAISLLFLYLFNNLGLVNYLISLIPAFTLPGWLYYLINGLLIPVSLLVTAVAVVGGLLCNVILYLGIHLFNFPLSTFQLGYVSIHVPQHVTPAGPNWLGDPAYALKTIMGLNIWTTTGTLMIIFMAALLDVPRDILEAAAIDGCTGVRAITRVVLPLIRPALFFVIAMGLIGCLQVFDQAFVMSQGSGGPENSTMTAVLYIYNQAFTNGFYGVAAAASFVLFVFIFVTTLLVRRLLGGEV